MSWGDEAADRTMEEYTASLGIWQHLISCGKDGRVMMHSWARAERPREMITPSVVALSPRGELAAVHEDVVRSWDFYGFIWDERTEKAPGN